MNLKNILLIVLIISLYSCNDKEHNQYERYFIPKLAEDNGIINKYYDTKYPADNKSIKTGLKYIYSKKINDSIYTKEKYNPAFRLESFYKFILKDSAINEVEYYRINPLKDTLNTTYPDNKTTITSFGNDSVQYSARLDINDSIYIQINQSSKVLKDTIVLDHPSKIVERSRKNTTFINDKLINTTHFDSRIIYVQDIGIWKSTVTTDKYTLESILVEQILPKKFDSLSKHGIQRVGYIDFDKTIDTDSKLELCYSHRQINDYYNGSNDRSGFIGGKGNLKKLVFEKLDTNKLNNESGYLTFRFVINCKGKAGKFVTNEADFEYTKKQFSKETVIHLYDIISSVENWKPCIIRNEKRDSYFYITFILKNGKIQDILP